MKERLAALIKTKSRDEWCSLLEGTDACFAPVLDPGEAPQHPHNQIRQTFVERLGVVQPAPAPRFSRTAPEISGPPPGAGMHTDEGFEAWGFARDEIAKLREVGAIR